MNYIKVQQELLADILDEKSRGVAYYHDGAHDTTMLFNSAGSVAFVIPDKLVAVNLTKCHALQKIPCYICPADPEKEITTDGSMRPSENGKGVRLIYKNKQGAPVYMDKKLREKFSKDARLYQEKPLSTITVIEGYITVGYLCPCRPPKDPTENQ